MAVALAAPEMAARALTFVTPRAAAFLAEEAFRRRRKKRLRYFSMVEGGASLAGSLRATIEALRHSGLSPDDMAAGKFEVPGKGADLKSVFAEYLGILDEQQLVDHAGLIEMATRCLRENPERLGRGTMVLVPDDMEMTPDEKSLLDALPGEALAILETDGPPLGGEATFGATSSVGEVNEVRGVLRSCLAHGIPYDEVEILHADRETYVPLIYETLLALECEQGSDDADVPVTFAEGIPCDYSRPGRALRSWLQWIEGDFPQAGLVRMMREGLLLCGGAGEGRKSFLRLARLLRSLGIGFGRRRYLEQIERRRAHLRRGDSPRSMEADDLSRLGLLVEKLCGGLGGVKRAPLDILAAARVFLESSARGANRLDEYAREALTGEIDEMEHWLRRLGEGTAVDITAWLEALPGQKRIMGSRPLPGCLHVDHLLRGGHTGRRHTFILGLDDSRFPGRGLQDPLLLDSERRRLSPSLRLAARRREEESAAALRLLARLRGKVTLSFPSREVIADRELFPSPLLAGLSLPEAVTESFAPREEKRSLSVWDWWLWKTTRGKKLTGGERLLRERFRHLARGFDAARRRRENSFTPWDGLVPRAGDDLDPRLPDGPVMSASRLEMLGACPRRFFFRYALDVCPPDDLLVDPRRWLDPRARGSLLHELFEDFVAGVMALGRAPEFAVDRSRIEGLLAEKVAAYRSRYPPRGESAFSRELSDLRRTALTFLREEERYRRSRVVAPICLEMSMGLPGTGEGTPLDTVEPCSLPLPGAAAIRVRGRIDRIDRVGTGEEEFEIWDYKTGGNRGYRLTDPYRQGRRVQHWLYLEMASRRLKETVSSQARVSRFGFFFPGGRGAGQRIAWKKEQLEGGGEILAELCSILSSGSFVATNNPRLDCGWCDYMPVCGDLENLARATDLKMSEEGDGSLASFCRLRPDKLKA
jgi:ATP-dependent helicase/nuclease subunit B